LGLGYCLSKGQHLFILIMVPTKKFGHAGKLPANKIEDFF